MAITTNLNKTIIMGILNVTPDSFADGGKYLDLDKAIKRAKLMVAQGVDIIDIGGESTRPYASDVCESEELNRVIPVIKVLSAISNVRISVDTSKPQVMKQAVLAGASMINDVYALQKKSALQAVATLDVDVCLMHMQGIPQTMQSSPKYKDVIDDIKFFFENRIKSCISAGIKKSRIILDPGFGFGKTLAHNIEILRRLSELKIFELPVLIGMSNKSMIGAMLNNKSIDKRLIGSVTMAIIAVLNGADIVRVHDILATKDALTILRNVA